MANNLQIKDSNAAAQTLKTTETGGIHTPHHNVDKIAPATALVFGNSTLTNGSAAAIVASTTALTSGVTVKADSTNTASVYIGGATLTTSKYYLLEAGQSVFLEIDDLVKVYVLPASTGQKISWLGA